MSNTVEWLERVQGGPVLKTPSELTWEQGPVNPETHCPHTYVISGMDHSTNPETPEGLANEVTLYFQNGVVTQHGLNGITPSILLEILINRFEHFQKGPFACAENDDALAGMRQAIEAINRRLADRQQRGVANTLEK